MNTLAGRIALAIGLSVSVLIAAEEKKAGDAALGKERLVNMEVALFEFVPRNAGLGDLEEESEEQLVARMQKLEQAGEAGVITRIRLSTIENQTATAQYGQEVAMVTGRASGAGGRGGAGAVSFSYQNLGTLLSVTPRVDDGVVLIKLVLEKSGRTKAAVPDEQSETAEDSPPTKTVINIQTTLRVRDGRTVVAQAMDSSSGKESSQTVVLVTARVVGEK